MQNKHKRSIKFHIYRPALKDKLTTSDNDCSISKTSPQLQTHSMH